MSKPTDRPLVFAATSGLLDNLLLCMQELAAEGDRSSLYDIAKALLGLQAMFGCARILKGKGPAAASVHTQLSRMRQELSSDELPLPGACAHNSD